MIVAVEMSRDGDRHTPFPWQERRGLRVYRHALEREALLRPIGNTVYFMPPYVITPDEIDVLVDDGALRDRGRDMRLNRVYSDQPLVAGRDRRVAGRRRLSRVRVCCGCGQGRHSSSSTAAAPTIAARSRRSKATG